MNPHGCLQRLPSQKVVIAQSCSAWAQASPLASSQGSTACFPVTLSAHPLTLPSCSQSVPSPATPSSLSVFLSLGLWAIPSSYSSPSWWLPCPCHPPAQTCEDAAHLNHLWASKTSSLSPTTSTPTQETPSPDPEAQETMKFVFWSPLPSSVPGSKSVCRSDLLYESKTGTLQIGIPLPLHLLY